jgi:hypothetical protein
VMGGLAVASSRIRTLAHGSGGRHSYLADLYGLPASALPLALAATKIIPRIFRILVTACCVQGMAPYPGQARCLALGFWPECFRRLDVKGGRRSFPKETRSALDIEGKHVTIEGPSPDPASSGHQVFSASGLTCVKPGRDACGVVREWP